MLGARAQRGDCDDTASDRPGSTDDDLTVGRDRRARRSGPGHRTRAPARRSLTLCIAAAARRSRAGLGVRLVHERSRRGWDRWRGGRRAAASTPLDGGDDALGGDGRADQTRRAPCPPRSGAARSSRSTCSRAAGARGTRCPARARPPARRRARGRRARGERRVHGLRHAVEQLELESAVSSPRSRAVRDRVREAAQVVRGDRRSHLTGVVDQVPRAALEVRVGLGLVGERRKRPTRGPRRRSPRGPSTRPSPAGCAAEPRSAVADHCTSARRSASESRR